MGDPVTKGNLRSERVKDQRKRNLKHPETEEGVAQTKKVQLRKREPRTEYRRRRADTKHLKMQRRLQPLKDTKEETEEGLDSSQRATTSLREP